MVKLGFDLKLFEKQLAELKAKGIPVITEGDSIAGTFNGAVTTDVQPRSVFEEVGERYANYVIAERKVRPTHSSSIRLKCRW